MSPTGEQRHPDDKPKSPPRKMTNAIQRSGYRFLSRRKERAFLTGDVSDTANPWSMQTATLWGGMVALSVACVIALVMSLLKPAPEKGVDAIVLAQDSGMYVVYGDVLSPVTNLASARLIVGKPEKAQIVKIDSLGDLPRGPLMGIPSAPDNLEARSDDPPMWTMCDHRDKAAELSLTTVGSLKTTIIAGADVLDGNAKDLGEDKAMLVKTELEPNRLWYVFGSHRAEIGANDFPVHAALGLTPARIAAAQTWSAKLVNAIDTLPPITVPYVADRGRLSKTVDGRVIGDVLTVVNADGVRESYVVADNGVQKITPVVAALLINTGSRQVTVDDPEQVTLLNQVRMIDTKRYPATLPEIMSPQTMCYSWSLSRDKETGDPVGDVRTRVIYSDNLPLTEDGFKFKRPLLKPVKGVVQADDFVMTPGKGWFVRVGSDRKTEQVMFIEDTGVRYFIAPDASSKPPSYEPTLSALGLNWQRPMFIPWSMAEVFTQGSTLSREAALMEHGLIPSNPAGQTVAPHTDAAPAPEEEAGP